MSSERADAREQAETSSLVLVLVGWLGGGVHHSLRRGTRTGQHTDLVLGHCAMRTFAFLPPLLPLPVVGAAAVPPAAGNDAGPAGVAAAGAFAVAFPFPFGLGGAMGAAS